MKDAFIEVHLDNIECEHICCAIGNDKQNQLRAQSKKEWLKERFKEGLVFKRLDTRGKVFVEYMPIEKVWKPLLGSNYMVINCLWVSGQYKGQGISTQLLNFCLEDAKAKGMDGVVIVSSNKVKPFLTDKKFFTKHGFEVVDKATPYFELLAYKFNVDSDTPTFTEDAKTGQCHNHEGFTFIYSNQCPFMEEYVELLVKLSQSRGIKALSIRLKDYKEAQSMGSPFGTLGIYYKGEFETHELMPEKKFSSFIDTLVGDSK